MFFAKEFNPKRIKKCDTYKSRSKIIKDTNKNLRYLLEKRFFWMKKFIRNKKNIIEVGSGNGSLTKILRNKTIFLRFFQFILTEEPWSLKVNIFNSKKNIFRSNNPWASNTAVARLLFDDEDQFNHFFPEYKICRNDLSEFFIFFNSGGVYIEVIYIPLNKFFLKLLDYIDSILIFFFPKIFALNRTIILKKIR